MVATSLPPAPGQPAAGPRGRGTRRRPWETRAGTALFTVLLAQLAVEPVVFLALRRRPVGRQFVYHDQPALRMLADGDRLLLVLAASSVLVGLLGLRRPALRGRAPSVVLGAVAWAGAVWLTADVGYRPAPSSGYAVRLAVAVAVGLLPRLPLDVVTRQVRFWCRCYVWGSLLAALLVTSWAMQPLPDGFGRPLGPPRLYGLTGHPNHLAPVAALAVVLELALPRRRRRLGWLNVAAACAVVVLTGSLTGGVTLVLSVALLLALRRRRSSARPVRRPTLALGGAGLVLMAAAAAVHGGLTHALHLVVTVDGRTSFWRAAVRAWSDHKLLGYGPHLFDETMRRRYLGLHQANIDSAHDQYLQALAQAGLVGAVALAGYVAALVRAVVRSEPEHRPRLAAALCVLLLSMTTEVVLHSGPSDVFFFLQSAIYACVLNGARSPAASSTPAAEGTTAAAP